MIRRCLFVSATTERRPVEAHLEMLSMRTPAGIAEVMVVMVMDLLEYKAAAAGGLIVRLSKSVRKWVVRGRGGDITALPSHTQKLIMILTSAFSL